MKIKFNWGTGIVIAIILFMAFILSFVFRIVFTHKYDHQLVDKEYYKDELVYQQQIDELKNAKKIKRNVFLKKTNRGLSIVFPDSLDYSKITGKVSFQRVSNQKLDFKNPLELVKNKMFISDSKLVKGRWNVKISWKYDKINYLFKDKLMY